ncbi:hypothetical protein NDU88_002709 [Pleurodeles waltl]|uniref:Uncharacterized protein n=1 Tax=Pleurodeles waltl TaxID=8319 RepID=A0AAV7PCG4_PLEWA|nr:hypothetical protein NDU88_002709 [Pleurodeles waltl]
MFVRSLKQPVRSGVYGMRGCIRGSSPSPPAVLGSLRTCAQGAAAAIVGPLGSSLVCVRVSLPSGPGRAAASLTKHIETTLLIRRTQSNRVKQNKILELSSDEK